MKKLLGLVLLTSTFIYAKQYNCSMCHGSELSQLTPAQIEQRMYQFRNGYGTMARVAQNMSDEEIKQAALNYGKK